MELMGKRLIEVELFFCLACQFESSRKEKVSLHIQENHSKGDGAKIGWDKKDLNRKRQIQSEDITMPAEAKQFRVVSDELAERYDDIVEEIQEIIKGETIKEADGMVNKDSDEVEERKSNQKSGQQTRLRKTSRVAEKQQTQKMKIRVETLREVEFAEVVDVGFNTDEKQLSCVKCSRSFESASVLHLHQIEWHGTGACDLCNYSSPWRLNLLRHIKAKHTGEKDYRCNECGKAFLEKRGLKSHLIKKHNIFPTA